MFRSTGSQLVDLLCNTYDTMFELNQLFRYKHREDARTLSLFSVSAQPISAVVLQELAPNEWTCKLFSV
jgi:hypothetical protein